MFNIPLTKTIRKPPWKQHTKPSRYGEEQAALAEREKAIKMHLYLEKNGDGGFKQRDKKQVKAHTKKAYEWRDLNYKYFNKAFHADTDLERRYWMAKAYVADQRAKLVKARDDVRERRYETPGDLAPLMMQMVYDPNK